MPWIHSPCNCEVVRRRTPVDHSSVGQCNSALCCHNRLVWPLRGAKDVMPRCWASKPSLYFVCTVVEDPCPLHRELPLLAPRTHRSNISGKPNPEITICEMDGIRKTCIEYPLYIRKRGQTGQPNWCLNHLDISYL